MYFTRATTAQLEASSSSKDANNSSIIEKIEVLMMETLPYILTASTQEGFDPPPNYSWLYKTYVRKVWCKSIKHFKVIARSMLKHTEHNQSQVTSHMWPG